MTTDHVPGVRDSWGRLPVAARVALVVVPLAVIAAVLAVDLTAGAVVAVLVVGAAAATLVFYKNRSDRMNAALDAERARRSGGEPG